MSFHKLMLPALATLALASVVPGTVVAQQRGSQVQRAANAEAMADMRSRLAEAIERVRVTERHGGITPARSAALRRQLGQAQAGIARLARRQGFVSAAELATYDRLVVGVDAELSAGTGGGSRSYGDDMLPSAGTTAFQRTDARLRYRDARIDHDASGCAVYQGIAPDGRIHREPLHDAAGRPICVRR